MNDPTIPLSAHMPHTAQLALLIGMTLGALISIGYAIRESRRRRDLALVWLVVGAGIAIFYEALGDALVKVYYTEHGQISWVHDFGRHIPAFIGILYFWYLPVGAYWIIRAAERGISARRWWTTWTGFLLFAIGFEMFVTGVGGTTWIYHGPQAFKVGDVPVLTPFTYVSFVLGIGLGVWALTRWLPTRQQWLIVPAVPVLMTASHAATSLPLAAALYSNTHNAALLDLGAIGSAALALVLAYVAGLVLRKPWPPRESARVQRVAYSGRELTPA